MWIYFQSKYSCRIDFNIVGYDNLDIDIRMTFSDPIHPYDIKLDTISCQQ